MVTVTELGSGIPTSIAQSAMPALCEALKGLSKDLIFSAMPLDKITADELLFTVATMGSGIERASLARHLSPEAAYSFPEMKSMAMANSKSMAATLNFLGKSIQSLAGVYGGTFIGDLETIPYTILQDYGGLTLADMLIFFERAKSGKYIDDYQHVASRGVNWHFLKTWLDAYCEQKEDARLSLHAQSGQTKRDTSAGELFFAEMEESKQKAKQERERREVLDAQAEKMRGEWEQELYKSVIIRQWYKTVRYEGSEPKEVLCDENDTDRSRSDQYPIKIFRDGAVERVTKRAIYEYVEFGDSAKTLETFEALKDDIDRRYQNETGDTESYRTAEMKGILIRVSTLQREFNAEKIIRTHIEMTHPAAPPRQVSDTVFDVVKKYEALYYNEYIPSCIESGYPPLKKQEFIWKLALESFTKDGNENPVRGILS